MRTLSLQLIAATALLLCTGCQTCYDNFMRFEAWKTEKCCSLFHCNHRPAAPVIYAPVAPIQQCPQPVPVAAAPCATPAPICAPIQCDPCANAAASPVSAAPCCPQPCCPPVCCPQPCCVTECCPSDCSVSYGGMSGCNSCGTSGGVIVSETPGYSGGTTLQGNPQMAPPGPASIVPGR